jgi:hypothetical protein
MRTIKASEIGSYVYCQRAWWYQQQGVVSENQAEMAAGTQIHHQHGRSVMFGGCLQTLALIAMLGAIVLTVLYFVSQVL